MLKTFFTQKYQTLLIAMLVTFGLYSCTTEDNSSSSVFQTVAVTHPVLGELTNNGQHVSCVLVNPASLANRTYISTRNMEVTENSRLVWFCNQKNVTFDVKMDTDINSNDVLFSNVSNGMITDYITSDNLFISNPTNAEGEFYVVCAVVEIPNYGSSDNDNIVVEVAKDHQNGQSHRASNNFTLGSYGQYRIACPSDGKFDLMEDVSGKDPTHYTDLKNDDVINCINGNIYIANSSIAMTVTFVPVITGEEWMSKISDSKKLHELSIPGTHDSSTFLASAGDSKCQNFDFTGQLASGIRFFDIRLNNDLGLCHGIDDLDGTFEDVEEAFINFLNKHDKEVILMSVKDESGDNKMPQKFIDYVKNSDIKDYLYTGTSIPTLGECRKKIVLLRRFDNPSGVSSYGIDLQTNWPQNTTSHYANSDGVKLYVEDHYYKFAEIHNTTDKAKEVRAAINAAASDDYKDYLFITFNSMALGEFFFGTPYHWAWEADPKLNDELYKTLQQYVSKKARLGVILMDYYNNHGSDDPYHNVQRIINTNFGDMYMKY